MNYSRVRACEVHLLQQNGGFVTRQKKYNPPPTGTGISGKQNTDATDVSTHAALHI
jgi:hypothetical protein